MNEDRLKRLAERLDRLAEKDEQQIERTRKVEAARRKACAQLHAMCLHLVQRINSLVTRFQVELSPDTFSEEAYRDTGVNLFQINAHGRLVQIAFEATDKLTSTEYFPSPYILQGAIRWYNQELLEGRGIEEEQLFLCWDERTGSAWRWLDPKTRRAGQFDADHLMGLVERL